METFLQLFRLLVPPLFVLLIVVLLVNAMGPTLLPVLAGCGLWMLYRLIYGDSK